MFPKKLKRAIVFESGVVTPSPERPGLYSVGGTYAVRSMENYFDPTGVYLPRDWSAPGRPEPGEGGKKAPEGGR
jgi:hypothetical protein